MPYIDIVNQYNQANRFAYNHKAVYKQVRRAMKKQGEARNAALKEVLLSAFRKEAPKYEAVRQQFGSDYHVMEGNEAFNQRHIIEKMATPARFLEQFAEVIGAMAQDIDRNYAPRYMLDLSAEDAKNLVDEQLNSYTCLEESMYSLKRDGWEEAYRQMSFLRTNVMDGTPHKYSTTDAEHKAGMHSLYARKEALKSELKNNGFWWRLFHRPQVREMRAYISEAEDTLRAVEFPETAIGEAMQEAGMPAALESDYQLAHHLIDKSYKEHQMNPDRETLQEKSPANDDKEKEGGEIQDTEQLQNPREPISVNIGGEEAARLSDPVDDGHTLSKNPMEVGQ